MSIDFSLDTGDCFTVNLPPRVSFPGFIQMRSGGECIGSIDAEFDFKNVPPEWHSLMIQVLRRQVVYCPTTYDCRVTEPEPMSNPPGFWVRVLKWRPRWALRRERGDGHVCPVGEV